MKTHGCKIFFRNFQGFGDNRRERCVRRIAEFGRLAEEDVSGVIETRGLEMERTTTIDWRYALILDASCEIQACVPTRMWPQLDLEGELVSSKIGQGIEVAYPYAYAAVQFSRASVALLVVGVLGRIVEIKLPLALAVAAPGLLQLATLLPPRVQLGPVHKIRINENGEVELRFLLREVCQIY